MFPAICGKAGENAGKLGEKSPGESRKARRGNGSGLGEMGEKSPAALDQPGKAGADGINILWFSS